MRTAIAAAAFLALATSVAQAQQPAVRTVPETEVAALFSKQKSTIVVDARMPDERGKWGLSCTNCSTINIPFDFGSNDKSAAAGAKTFSDAASKNAALQAAKASGQEVVVVCLAGGRSGAAAEQLAKMGVKTVVLQDGLGALKDTKNIQGAKPKG